MKKAFFSFIRSSIIYYVIGGTLLWAICDTTKVRLNRLNYYKSTASYPIQYMDGAAPFDKRQWYYARYYYENLLALVPLYARQGVLNGDVTMARAWAMIGICQFHLGHYQQAIEYMKRAAETEPKQFWFKYDLGVMYFYSHKDNEAIEQLKDLLAFSKEKLEAGMQLDYYELWPSTMAEEYKKITLQKYYQLLVNSYKISVLAAERTQQAEVMKGLSLSAIKAGLGKDGQFFYYHAGLVQEKPSAVENVINFLFPPAVYFVPVGQERLVLMKGKKQ